MKKQRLISIILIVIGVVLYLVGNHISGEVSQGRKRIESAQSDVDGIRGLTDLNPFSKEVGDIVTGSAQRKIDEGSQKADKYQRLTKWLHTGGAALFILGTALFAFSLIRKKRN